jgi:hypothetical protein
MRHGFNARYYWHEHIKLSLIHFNLFICCPNNVYIYIIYIENLVARIVTLLQSYVTLALDPYTRRLLPICIST